MTAGSRRSRTEWKGRPAKRFSDSAISMQFDVVEPPGWATGSWSIMVMNEEAAGRLHVSALGSCNLSAVSCGTHCCLAGIMACRGREGSRRVEIVPTNPVTMPGRALKPERDLLALLTIASVVLCPGSPSPPFHAPAVHPCTQPAGARSFTRKI